MLPESTSAAAELHEGKGRGKGGEGRGRGVGGEEKGFLTGPQVLHSNGMPKKGRTLKSFPALSQVLCSGSTL